MAKAKIPVNEVDADYVVAKGTSDKSAVKYIINAIGRSKMMLVPEMVYRVYLDNIAQRIDLSGFVRNQDASGTDISKIPPAHNVIWLVHGDFIAGNIPTMSRNKFEWYSIYDESIFGKELPEIANIDPERFVQRNKLSL